MPYKEIVKGYEVSDGKYVVLDKDEIKAAAGDRGKVIHLGGVRRRGRDRPGVLREDLLRRVAGRQDAYRLLHDALQQDRAGRDRALQLPRPRVPGRRPGGRGVLVLHTLRFHDEVVAGDELEIEVSSPQAVSPRGRRWPASWSRRWPRTSSRALRGHLPRRGARPDQAQGQGRGDRPGGAGGARARRRPAGRARGEPERGEEVTDGRGRCGADRSASDWSTSPSSWSAPRATSTITSTSCTRRTRSRSSSGASAPRRTWRSAGRRSAHGYDLDGKQVVVTDEELGIGAAAQDADDRHRGVRRARARSTRSTSTTRTS